MKSCLSFLVILMTFGGAYAQPELGECDQEIEELAAKQVPRALDNWKRKNYREAERYLKKAIDLSPNYADALFLLGDLYVRKSKLKRTIPLWEKLLEVCPNYKPEIAYYLGSIKSELGDRDEAIILFNAFLKNPERDRGYDKEVRKALEETELLKMIMDSPVDFKPKAIANLSTPKDEYLATISPDQQTLYFTRRSKKRNKRDGPGAPTRLVEEFSFSPATEEGGFEVGEPLGSPFNTNYNEGGPSITADNTELYFTVCQDLNGYKNCDIYYSEKDDYGYWISPRSVGDHINRRDAWESQAAVSANGDRLYFTSNRDGGVGGLDLYVCKRLEDGKWSSPENLGDVVNTPKNEKTPFIHSDSETLYFTSNGHFGLGGFDIFYVKAQSDSTWNLPKNIGFPINSPEDDLGLFVSLNGQKGYFASNKIRKGNGWDVYEFALPEAAQPERVALIQGNLTNESGEAVSDASMEIKNLKTREVTRIRVDKETGNYARAVKITKGEDLIVTVKKKGAAFTSKFIDSNIDPKNPLIKAPMKVAKLEVGKEYKLNDINFASNSYDLDLAARSVIDEFILFLNENSGLKADIQGHTDNVGNPSANKSLSRNRAKTVYNYVVDHGVPTSRLSYHGYGEAKPIADNTTDEGKAKNRRTVFVITSQ